MTSSDDRVVRNSSGTITSATIFTVNTPSTGRTDNVLQLGYEVAGNSTTPLWSSSAPSVATVSQSGRVVGLKAGTSTITCASQDGSGKKAAIKVTVIIPTAYLTIVSKGPSVGNTSPSIGFGKSFANTVVFGDTYGVPSVKKVEWSFQVYETDTDDVIVSDWTDYFKANKRVSVSSSGTLTVSSAMKNDWYSIYGNFTICVTASSCDGSGVQDYIWYDVQPLTTKIIPDYYTYYSEANSYFYAEFYASSLRSDFTITSSNPSVAGVKYGYGLNEAPYFYVGIYTFLPGTAKITIKSNDGSGVSGSFTVKVY